MIRREKALKGREILEKKKRKMSYDILAFNCEMKLEKSGHHKLFTFLLCSRLIFLLSVSLPLLQ